MNHIHTRLLSISAGAALLLMPLASASAETATRDGTTLANQPAATQQMFQAAWGSMASDRWAMEHNAQTTGMPMDPGMGMPMDSGMGMPMDPGMMPSPGQPSAPMESPMNQSSGMSETMSPKQGNQNEDNR